jgi:hypothetical protein
MANYLTQQDVDNYGSELLDVSQRAALHALGPHIQNIAEQNAQLRQQVAREARHRLDGEVATLVPDYKTIDADPGWHRWLLGIDLMSGRVRQTLLNEAISAGDARQVKTIFDRYRGQATSTSSHASTSHASTSSGRRSSSSSYKPIYTRQQIAQLFEQHRKGAYAGREQEWARLEHDIIAAGREGRVLNPVDLAGK